MRRLLDNILLEWASTDDAKPLLLRGARQVGKTYCVRQLGKRFRHFVEINFEETPEAGHFFDGPLTIAPLVSKLSAFAGKPIRPGESLLFLDEVQKVPRVLASLRFFREQMPDLRVVAAGSLLEFAVEEVPSFAVGRTQELIFELNRIYEDPTDPRQEQLSKIKVYVDSPMAAAATEVFKNNAQVFDEETKDYISKGENPLEFPNLKFTQSTEESQWLNVDKEPKVIISASGMCEAGRIRHHLKHNLWDARNSIIFVGYQAEGTLGRCIIDGEKDVTLFGETIHVNAQIHNLEGFSGHADMNGLLGWLKGFQKGPKQLFLVHGEPEVKLEFAKTVKEQIGIDAIPVNVNSEYELEAGGGVVTRKEAIADAVDEKRVNEARENLYNVRRRLEDILYNANLSVNNGTDPEKLARINNIIMELEKSVINLGSVISESEESENVELTDEQIAELKAAREEITGKKKKSE